MFPDYQALVLRDYQQKKIAGPLSYRLINPTTADIRDECIAVLKERYDKKDEKVLSVFFGYKNGEQLTEELIWQLNIARFKPLVNFLRNPKIKTKEINVELLAWLIDFQPRPYDYQRKYPAVLPQFIVGAEKGETVKGSEENTGNPVPPVAGETINLPQPIDATETSAPVKDFEETAIQSTPETPIEKYNSPKSPPRPWWHSPIFYRSTLVAAMLLIILTIQHLSTSNRLPEKCMYWAGDQYKPISCNEQRNDVFVIAQDAEKLRSFKKINRPDTITRQSIGHVWYAKVNKEVQFYTGGGYHPENPNLRLKPITDYMIRKYITQKIAAAE